MRSIILILQKNHFMIGNNQYSTGQEFSNNFISTNDSITESAMKFINSPYIWGGRIPSGIDCSGLTQLVYKIHGITIPRNSWQQAETGKIIDFIDQTEPGDLVFFDNEQGENLTCWDDFVKRTGDPCLRQSKN